MKATEVLQMMPIHVHECANLRSPDTARGYGAVKVYVKVDV